MCKFGLFILGGKLEIFVRVGSSRVSAHARRILSPRRVKLLRDGCACVARVKLGMRNVRRGALNGHIGQYRVGLHVGDHLGSLFGS